MNRRFNRLLAGALVITIVLSAMQTVMPTIRAAVPPPPAFWVLPGLLSFNTITHPVGTLFNVTVWCAVTTNATAWQVKLKFDPTQLQAVAAGYTGVDKSMFFTGHDTVNATPAVDNVAGTVLHAESLVPSDYVDASSNSLFFVTFTITAAPPVAMVLTSLIDTATYFPASTFVLDTNNDTETPFGLGNSTYNYVWMAPQTPHIAVLNFTTNSFNMLDHWVGTTFDEHVTIRSLDALWSLTNVSTTFVYNGTLLAVTNVTFNSLWTGANTFDNATSGILKLFAQAPSSIPSGDEEVASVTMMILNQGIVPPRLFGSFDESERTLVNTTLYSSIAQIGLIPVVTDAAANIRVYATPRPSLPYLSVDGGYTPYPISGQLFNVTVSFNNVVGAVQHLTAVRYRLQYDNNTLQAINATEGSYFKYFAGLEPGSLGTIFQNNIQSDPTFGWNVNVSQAIRPNATGKYNEPLPDGSGVIAIVTFKLLYQPLGNITTPLNITDQLATGLDNMFSQNQVAVTLEPPMNGDVTVTRLDHDVAIINIASPKTIFCIGYVGNMTVTAANWGISSETFNATVYANGTAISTFMNVTLIAGELATLTTQWNTTGFAVGNYTLNAYAWSVLNETNTDNNNLTGSWVIVSIVGDITGPNGWADGKVDIRDVSLVARHFGETVPPAPANSDLTGPTQGVPDGKIDIRDVSLVAKHFGEGGP